jgi:hypothetical protein
MSVIGPDLQTLIVRSPEAGKIQQTQKTGEQVTSQNFATELKKQSESAGDTIQYSPRAEQGKIDGDRAGQERRQLQQGSDRKKEEEELEEQAPAPNDAGSTGRIIDCRI